MGWIEFILSLVVFFVLHAVPVRPPVKGWFTARIGARGFTMLYSAVSLATLTWIIVAAGRASYVELWPLTTATRHAALAIMAVSVALLALGIARPNPLSFGGANNDRFDPDHPGIVGWVRHPLLVAIGLWALAHLVANGGLAHVILFGLFAGFAALGTRIVDRRKQRELGAEWARLADTRREFRVTASGLVRLAAAAALYAGLIALHGPVIGAYPL